MMGMFDEICGNCGEDEINCDCVQCDICEDSVSMLDAEMKRVCTNCDPVQLRADLAAAQAKESEFVEVAFNLEAKKLKAESLLSLAVEGFKRIADDNVTEDWSLIPEEHICEIEAIARILLSKLSPGGEEVGADDLD